MSERAVENSKSPPRKWVENLLKMYSDFAQGQARYRRISCVSKAIELQRGEASAPLVEFGKSLTSLPRYCFQRMSRLASKILKTGVDGRYQKSLLGYLCQAQKGLGDYRGLLKTAKKLNAMGSDLQALTWIAEAYYEQGKGDSAKKIAKIAAGKNHGIVPKSISLHREIYLARWLVAKKSTPENNGKLAAALRALGDPEVVLHQWNPADALKLGNPTLDEVYTQALLDDGFRYLDAWNYARRTKGVPQSSGFLGFRIGAGMAVLLHGLLSPKGSHHLDDGIRRTVQEDLSRLATTRLYLAKRTGFVLRLMDVIAGENAHNLAKAMAGDVKEFVSENKNDLQALTLAFVVKRFGVKSLDTWKLMRDYIKKSKNRLDSRSLSLLCLSAIENALSTRSTKALETVSTWIETQADMDSRMDLKLWRANVSAVRGLLLKGLAQSKQLQRSVDLFGSVLAGAANDRGTNLDSHKLCDIGTSLATLMMQGGSLDQARGLMGQLLPLCKDFPISAAVSAVMNIAAGDEGKMKESLKNLEKLAGAMPSMQARLQSMLWLGLAAKANKDGKMEKKHFSDAAKLFEAERKNANPLILAPDLRSMVALSSNMELSAGYEKENPLRLGIEISLGVGFVLFPPAAVDQTKLSEFIKK